MWSSFIEHSIYLTSAKVLDREREIQQTDPPEKITWLGKGEFSVGKCKVFCKDFSDHWLCNLGCYPQQCYGQGKPTMEGCGEAEGL